MAQIDDFLKMLDEQDYSRALKKEKTKKAVRKATAIPKPSPEEMLAEEIQIQRIRKEAKETVNPSKPVTKQQRMEAEVKKLKTQDDLNQLTGRGKAEEGADAVDRLLDEYKKARDRAYDKEGEPLLPGQMEEKTIIKGRRSIPLPGTDRVIPVPFLSKEIETDTPGYDPRGKKGSTLRIANERIDEVRDDLDLAQKAKEEGLTLQEARRNKKMDDKYREYLKMFSGPNKNINQVNKARMQMGLSPLEGDLKGVDPRKAKYMAELQTKSFFSK